VQLRLLPFGEAALRHFVYLERPEGLERADAEGIEPADPTPLPMRPRRSCRGATTLPPGPLVPFHRKGFARLVDKLGEDRLFIGPAFQR
jgi:hypothetical protein